MLISAFRKKILDKINFLKCECFYPYCLDEYVKKLSTIWCGLFHKTESANLYISGILRPIHVPESCTWGSMSSFIFIEGTNLPKSIPTMAQHSVQTATVGAPPSDCPIPREYLLGDYYFECDGVCLIS